MPRVNIPVWKHMHGNWFWI